MLSWITPASEMLTSRLKTISRTNVGRTHSDDWGHKQSPAEKLQKDYNQGMIHTGLEYP